MLKNRGCTKDVLPIGGDFALYLRIKQLKTFYQAIKKNEDLIIEASWRDLEIPFESYATELSMVYGEIKHTLKHLKSWMKDEKAPTPVQSIGGKSYLHRQPLGVVLIMSPWNYPFQLTITPLAARLPPGTVQSSSPPVMPAYLNRPC